MKMGVANVYFGLCHMAAHVDLLTPKDDSHLEVERTLATGSPDSPYTENYPRCDTSWDLLQVTQCLRLPGTLSDRSQFVADTSGGHRHVTWVCMRQAKMLFGHMLTYMTFSGPFFLAHA